MAITEDIARLIIEADTKGFAEAQAKIDGTQRFLDNLTNAYKGGSITLEEYLEQGNRLRATIDSLTAAQEMAIDAVNRHGTTQKAVAALAEQSTASHRRLTTGIQQASYAFQDFTSTSGDWGQKLNSITNNVMYAAAQFGPYGVAIGVAMTAGVALYRNWDSLVGKSKEFHEALERLKDQLKTLEDKPVKLAIDYRDIEETKRQISELTRARAALERVGGLRGHYEKASGGEIEGMFAEAEGGGEAVTNRLKAEARKAMEAGDQKLNDARREVAQAEADRIRHQGLLQTATTEQQQADLIADIEADKLRAGKAREKAQVEKDRVATTAADFVGKMLSDALSGGGLAQQAAQKRLAEMLRGSGQGDLARGVELSSPRKIEEAEIIEEQFDAAVERQREGNKRRQEKQKRDKKALADDLKDQAIKDKVINDEAEARKKAKAKQATADKQAKAQDLQYQKELGAGAGKDFNERLKGLQATDLDERAAAMAAEMRAAGGADVYRYDRQGNVTGQKFQKLDAQGQQELLQKRLAGQIQQANPNLNWMQTGALATRMAANASKTVDSNVEQARMRLAEQGVKGQALSVGAMQQALVVTTTLATEQAALHNQVQTIDKGFRTLERQVRGRQAHAQRTNPL